MERTNRAIIEIIKQKKGFSLFYFLGCFSLGPKLETLIEIWDDQDALMRSLHLFQKLGIMEPSSNGSETQRKTLNLSLRKVVQKMEFEHCDKIYMTELCKHFNTLFMKLQENYTPSKTAHIEVLKK